MDISMDIHGYIHIHKRLSCVHIVNKFSRNRPTAVPERQFPPDISFVKLLKNKIHLHWNMILEKYFPALMKIYRNYVIALAIAVR